MKMILTVGCGVLAMAAMGAVHPSPASCVRACPAHGAAARPVSDFLDRMARPDARDKAFGAPVLTVSAGSSNLVERISWRNEEYGGLLPTVTLRTAEGAERSLPARRVTAVREVAGAAGGEGLEVTVRFGAADGAEATFRLTTWSGRRAILAELVSGRALGKGDAFEAASLALRAPFHAIDVAEAVLADAERPRRSAWHAIDGRWIGAVSAAEAEPVILTDLRFAPGTWKLFLLGTDGRSGWRDATARLPIFPGGDPVQLRAARRKVRTEIRGASALRGGRSVAVRAFRPVRDAAVLARLPAESAGRVLELDLTAPDLARYEAMLAKGPRSLGAFADEMPFFPFLFVDGERQTIARWPNGNAWANIAAFDEPGRCSGGEVASKPSPPSNPALPSFFCREDRLARWTKAPDAFLHGFWCYDWYDEIIPLAGVEPAAKRLRLAAHTAFGVRKGNPSPRRWRVFNLVEEIDEPGEFAIDRQAKKLYFLPPKGFGAASRVSLVTEEDTLFKAEGLRDVEFRGLRFESCGGVAVRLKNCENVVFRDCTFSGLPREAVVFDQCRHCALVNCTAEHLGNGAFAFYSGDRKTLARGDNLIDGCTIRNFNELFWTDGLAVGFHGVGDTLRNSFIANSPHTAIWACGANDMTIAGNVVSNVCNATDDAGAYYQGRNASARGNELRNNTWIDIGRVDGHGLSAVYFDDGDGGNLVSGDTFIRSGVPGRGGSGAVFSHGGHDNWVRDCTFVDCRRPFGSYPWPQARWEDFIHWKSQHALFDSVVKGGKDSPYFAAYPEVARRYEPEPESVRVNYAVDCTLAGCPARLPTSLPGESNPGIFSGNWKLSRVTCDTLPAPKTVRVPAGTGDDTAAVRAAAAQLADGDTLAFEDGKTYTLKLGTNVTEAVFVQRFRDLRLEGRATVTCPDARPDVPWIRFFQCQRALEIEGLSFKGTAGTAVEVLGAKECSVTLRGVTFDGPITLRLASYGTYGVRHMTEECVFLHGARLLSDPPTPKKNW